MSEIKNDPNRPSIPNRESAPLISLELIDYLELKYCRMIYEARTDYRLMDFTNGQRRLVAEIKALREFQIKRHLEKK